MKASRMTVASIALALLVGAGVTACGDASDSSSATTGGGAATTGGGGATTGGAATTSGGDASDTPAITITASEYKFEVTGEATGGFVQVTFDNAGQEPHIVVPLKLQPGKTAADALPILSQEGEPDPAALAEVFDGDPTNSFFGTPGLLPPDDSETTVANFTPGSYVLACFLPSPDGTPHFALGMLTDFTVGDGDTPAPSTQGTFEIADDSITAPEGVQSGVYAVENKGTTPSDFNVAGPTEASMSDFDDAVNGYFATIGSGETAVMKLPAPLVAGFSESIPVGKTGYIVVDLDSGRYLMAGNSDDQTGATLVSGEFEVG